MAMEVRRFDVFVVALDPTVGREIRKSRPCVVISPDEMNAWISTVIVAPMTTKGREYPTRISCKFRGKAGQVVLDQIRTIDRGRLIRKLGKVDAKTGRAILSVLQEMFG